MYTNNRDAYRQTFYSAWEKQKKKLPLEPVEAQLVTIMMEHPEYHAMLDSPSAYTQEFLPEENPFMHMSLHLAIREQIQLDRPQGIKTIYQTLATKLGSSQNAEHVMLTCLGQMIWRAQETGQMPEESEYLLSLKNLL